jgi:hypothetical protein
VKNAYKYSLTSADLLILETHTDYTYVQTRTRPDNYLVAWPNLTLLFGPSTHTNTHTQADILQLMESSIRQTPNQLYMSASRVPY